MKIIISTCLIMLFTLPAVFGESELPANKEKNNQTQVDLRFKIKKWFDRVTTPEEKIFTPEEINIIKKYLNETSVKKKDTVKKKSLPPGLAKKLSRGGTLPPGWQMKVARGEVLDYEIYSKAIHLPEDILKKLSTLPEGTILLQVGNKIVKVIETSRIIIDLFEL